jgi:hypothetical protein
MGRLGRRRPRPARKDGSPEGEKESRPPVRLPDLMREGDLDQGEEAKSGGAEAEGARDRREKAQRR